MAAHLRSGITKAKFSERDHGQIYPTGDQLARGEYNILKIVWGNGTLQQSGGLVMVGRDYGNAGQIAAQALREPRRSRVGHNGHPMPPRERKKRAQSASREVCIQHNRRCLGKKGFVFAQILRRKQRADAHIVKPVL